MIEKWKNEDKLRELKMELNNMSKPGDFKVVQNGEFNFVIYSDVMYYTSEELKTIEKILKKYRLKICTIGANLDGSGTYIETIKVMF